MYIGLQTCALSSALPTDPAYNMVYSYYLASLHAKRLIKKKAAQQAKYCTIARVDKAYLQSWK